MEHASRPIAQRPERPDLLVNTMCRHVGDRIWMLVKAYLCSEDHPELTSLVRVMCDVDIDIRDLFETWGQFERDIIEIRNLHSAFRGAKRPWRVTSAANYLGISRSAIYQKLHDMGLHVRQFQHQHVSADDIVKTTPRVLSNLQTIAEALTGIDASLRERGEKPLSEWIASDPSIAEST